jgi:hypothetical protein
MPGRTWIIAPDTDSLERRWERLIKAPKGEREALFHPHLRGGKPGDKHLEKVVLIPLSGFPQRSKPVSSDTTTDHPIQYAFRSFDRQWIIPDSRLINQPNPELWAARSERQLFLTALSRTSPRNGPAVTLTGLVPDLDHYKGSFGGRVIPLWRDRNAETSNFRPQVLQVLSERIGTTVQPEELFAYIAGIAAHPAFTARFKSDLSTPGLRIPLTADAAIFQKAVKVGRRVVWLHTFGERMADASESRPAGPPRVLPKRRPTIPAEGTIPQDAANMPDSLSYDASARRLYVGSGYIENVEPEVWNYEVSGKHVLRQWFSYRKRNRERPIIGDRRPPSRLAEIQPDHWLSEYTSELMNVLNVLTLLVELEPEQAKLLDEVCEGSLISVTDLKEAGALEPVVAQNRRRSAQAGPRLFD